MEQDRPLSPQARYARLVSAGRSAAYRGHRNHHRVKQEKGRAKTESSPSRSVSPAPGLVSGQALPVHMAQRMAEGADLPEPELVVQATGKVMEALDLILVNPGTHMSTLLMMYRRIRITVEAREEAERAQAA